MTVYELMKDLEKFSPDQKVEMWDSDANYRDVHGVYEATVTRGLSLPQLVTSKIVVLYP